MKQNRDGEFQDLSSHQKHGHRISKLGRILEVTSILQVKKLETSTDKRKVPEKSGKWHGGKQIIIISWIWTAGEGARGFPCGHVTWNKGFYFKRPALHLRYPAGLGKRRNENRLFSSGGRHEGPAHRLLKPQWRNQMLLTCTPQWNLFS